jgi:hypothetical protein
MIYYKLWNVCCTCMYTSITNVLMYYHTQTSHMVNTIFPNNIMVIHDPNQHNKIDFYGNTTGKSPIARWLKCSTNMWYLLAKHLRCLWIRIILDRVIQTVISQSHLTQFRQCPRICEGLHASYSKAGQQKKDILSHQSSVCNSTEHTEIKCYIN